ncbi:alpha/beta fold hydrolase [Streptomyces cyaneochromogenes]|uniref:Alpha/beta fold hydrolase n=1 Tax=Streptomyces cyaneochromogenes TaxID=2496836 RepID=A0A3Q9EM03_9ACTN|nr:alpha/beta fold hydrolase [Streptomyces cyaneochromogenes]AZQ33521.1 alpha/beta fold hydrolase [Streptomyces cyaneochromogenes]
MRARRTRRTVRLLALAVMAALCAFGLTAPAGAADTPPPGANNWSCKPDSAHPQPVVLVNGTFKTSYENWLTLSPALADAGHCVFSFEYGDLETAPVADSAAELRDFVNAVLGATGAKKADLVGHSQGGMMPRYYVKFLGGATKVDDLVGIVPSNHGTTNPLALVAGATVCPSCVDQTAGSDFLQKLNADPEAPVGPDYTAIATRYDEVVLPYTSSFLDGPASYVTNVLLQDRCPLNITEHDQATKSPLVESWVLNALKRDGPADPAFVPRCVGSG